VSEEQEEITVLVTGFAPFRPQNPLNPAWEIAHSLPPFLPQSATTTTLGRASPKVRILVHPEPIKVAYKAVRELVPQLWENGGEGGEKKIDYLIHIGMATGRKWYSIERKGHRDGYDMKDVDGEVCEDGGREKVEEEAKDVEENANSRTAKWLWEGLPAEIETSIDVDDVWKRWRISLPNHDLRISNDAGRYLCDFIYYSSLAELTKRDEKRRVLFLHVPLEADKEAISNGVQVTCELIRGIVASGRLKGLGELGSIK